MKCSAALRVERRFFAPFFRAKLIKKLEPCAASFNNSAVEVFYDIDFT